ncbi:hypothetical protein BSKO_00952 [Bryopsis sp. KO-2023]|nr:hypothetical protein BSKO_00952 [Bryopsis sp. KO-2023]
MGMCTRTFPGVVGKTSTGRVANESWFGPKFFNPLAGSSLFWNLDFCATLWGVDQIQGGRMTTLVNNGRPTGEDIKKAFPVCPVGLSAFSSEQRRGLIQCLWIGHASNLVGIDDGIFLTDPVFPNRCGPFQASNYLRFVPPPFTLTDAALPKIDFVVISHNHYDHLDQTSVGLLHSRFGDQLRWYVPFGLKSWFLARGISNVVELDWWENVVHPTTGLRLTLTPCQHWSGRRVLDARRSLWGSWLVEGDTSKVWFGGDSGYCPVFKEIGEKHGPIDLAMIPIGAYQPQWFMRHEHVNPEEAVKIHKDIRSKFSIGMHCCAFQLSREPLDEPPMLLKQAAEIGGLAPKAFVTLQHGSVLQIEKEKVVNDPSTLPLVV